MGVRVEVVPMLVVAVVIGAIVALACHLFHVQPRTNLIASGAVTVVLGLYFLYFFRDPDRTPPSDPDAVIAGADGLIMGIQTLEQAEFARCAKFSGLNDVGPFKGGPVVRISTFLNIFNVHVNRSPLAGSSRFLGYFPGKHIVAFSEKSSEFNQHNSVLIENDRTVCLFNQIVGPIARRVVYWPDHEKAVPVKAGDRLGMMKFGSRLDLYFPAGDIELKIKKGDKTTAGETVIAVLKRK